MEYRKLKLEPSTPAEIQDTLRDPLLSFASLSKTPLGDIYPFHRGLHNLVEASLGLSAYFIAR